ncbi:MAG TPA: NapC/NirT family cytochrome c [Nitrospiraceae bacterium]|nr:NapC/NirT family cytochrome c [Nitrospiraceae bacterium]
MTRKSPAIVIGAIIAGAVALGGAAIPLTNHPKFCASCHTIRPSYESWVQSTHKEVECISCHVRPGVEGWLYDKAWKGTKDVAISLFGTPPPSHDLQSHVDSSVCLSCHRNILRVSEIAVRDLPPPVKDVGLIMSHRKHMDAFAERAKGEGCTTCHGGVVHDRPIKDYPIVIPRGHVSADSKPWLPEYPENSVLRRRALSDCFRCHDNKTEHKGAVVSRKCEICHLPEKLEQFLSF